jgi:uncharacterized protein (TIGR02757 family)
MSSIAARIARRARDGTIGAHVTKLERALDDVRARCDVPARLAVDPVGVVRRYADPLDREIVGLVAAGIAFGNVKTIRSKLEELLERVHGGGARGTSRRTAREPLHRKAEDLAAMRRALAGFRHRVFVGDDVARLLHGARTVQKRHGTLGARFAAELASTDLREALARLCDEIREAGDLRVHGKRRGPAHLLADPRAGSTVKRLLLWVKWMVRPDDGIDLGLWRGVPTSALLIPVDTHIHKLSRNLGLTRRKDASWKTAVEITAALARLDAADPTKYDFSLCHMGMLQRCPSRRDPKRCEGCPVMPVCRHWARGRSESSDRNVKD